VLSSEAAVNTLNLVVVGEYKAGYKGAVAHEATGGTAVWPAANGAETSNVGIGAPGYIRERVLALKTVSCGVTHRALPEHPVDVW
jgi:hypothetical protein